MPVFTIRPAAPDDATLVLALIRELADYEKLLHEVLLTEAAIARDFFGPSPSVTCELAFEDDSPVGIIVWYWTYSTFAGGRGIFLEDLYVRPDWRGKGYGKALLQHLARRGAKRLEWLVLDWNRPSIKFYQSIGAKPRSEWRTCRLEGAALKTLGAA